MGVTSKEAKRREYQRHSEAYKKRASDRYYANREKCLEYARCQRQQPGYLKRMALRKYGLTVEQYDSLVVQQSGVCAICHQRETHIQNKRLAVDHDHRTHKVRGLLCSRCNVALGMIQDNPLIAKNMMEYLEEKS